MAILNPTALRDRGAGAAAGYSSACRRLVLVYCGVIALLTLGINGLHLYLDSHIGETGGLSGLGMRSVLQTVQELLGYINILFGPFWSAGFLYGMIRLARGQEPDIRDLTEGFRRFWRVLGQLFFQFVLLLALTMAVSIVAAVIFSMTPMGAEFAETMTPYLSDPAVYTPEGMLDMT